MRRSSPGREPPNGDAVVLAGVGTVVAVVGWLWATAEVSAWARRGRWPQVHLGDVMAALPAIPRHLSHPGRAWPPGTGMAATGALSFWGWAAALAIAALASVMLVWHNRRTGWRRGGGRSRGAGGGPSAGWARGTDMRNLAVRRRGAPGRLVVGCSENGRRLLATEARHSLLVIGPTQSGKTTGLAVPSILEWPGPVLATSVKDDLAAATFRWRAGAGPVAAFDPTSASSLPAAARWSPLTGCAEWSGAQRMASWLVESTPGRQGLADAAFWYSAAAKQLGPLMLAADRGGLAMSDVVRWVDTGEFDEPLRLLEVSAENEAAVALAACAGRDERIRSSVATTLETVLSPFSDPVVAAATSGSDIDTGLLLARRGTLYLCGPASEQHRVQGLFASLVSTVVAEAMAMAASGGGPIDPPLLIVLDEVANIAPVRDLDTLASTAAGLGIQLVTICQDLAQLTARYGPERSRTIANNHRAKLLLSGVADLGTLDLISGLAGEQAVVEHSNTHDLRDGRRTRATSTVLRRLAPADELRRLPPGRGVLIYGHLAPMRIRLRPWFADRRLRSRVTGGPAGRSR